MEMGYMSNTNQMPKEEGLDNSINLIEKDICTFQTDVIVLILIFLRPDCLVRKQSV